jgi:hypothetical protein
MSSGSGNTVRILGASTTTAGIALLPATGQGWLAITMISIAAGGLAMVAFYAGSVLIKRLN